MPEPIDFEVVFEHLPDAIVVLDRELRCIACNQSYLRTTHMRKEDILGRRLLDAFPHDPNDLENPNRRRVRDSLEEVLATRAPVVIPVIPYRVPRSDGGPLEERFWSATHTPILGTDGEVVMIIQNTTDVTELERLERSRALGADVLGRAHDAEHRNVELHAALARLTGLVDQAPGFVVVLRGPDHVVELANRAVLNIPGQVLGKPLVEVFPELAGQNLIAVLEHAYATGETFVGRNMRLLLRRGPDRKLSETFVDVVCQPIVEDDGTITGIFMLGFEVTQQIQLQTERRALLELMPAFLWQCRRDGTTSWVNDRAVIFSGARREQLLENGWLCFVAPDDRQRVMDAWHHSLETGEPYEAVLRMRRHDGVYFWYLMRANPLRDGSGEITGWLGAGIDVDAQRRARDELERRAAYEKRLIGIVSHDLRNPLSAISMGAAMALEMTELPPIARSAVARIASAADRATRLVGDFMDLAQARSGEIPLRLAVADLREVVRTAIDELRQVHAGHEIALDVGGGDMTLVCDRDRVAQVLGNLVNNAVQHGAEGRPIAVHLELSVAAVELAVHNEGTPIPAADIPHVFEPFWRSRSSRGVGLGLYIAHEIIAAHAGELTVQSGEAGGTTFTIRLPREHA